MKRLNVGCGRDIKVGWTNLDCESLPGVDVVYDLNRLNLYRGTVPRIPVVDSTYDEIYMSHVLEHLESPLAVMQELHRIAAPGATCIIKVPYGSSDIADEDPTHLHRFFIGSWQYFSQLAYKRADYRYRGDWRIITRKLLCNEDLVKYRDRLPDLFKIITHGRNFVIEMTAILECIKPIRNAQTSGDVEAAPVEFDFAKVSRAANEDAVSD